MTRALWILPLLGLGCLAGPGEPPTDSGQSWVGTEFWESLESSGWIRATVGNLSIVSNADEEVVREFIERFEVTRAAFGAATGTFVSRIRLPTRVILFESSLGYRYFRPADSVAGYYIANPQGPLIVANAGRRRDIWIGNTRIWGRPIRSSERDQTVLHEYAHLLLRDSSGGVPPMWYDEGFAQLLSTAQLVDGGFEIGRRPVLGKKRFRRWQMLPMLTLLRARNFAGWERESIFGFYTQSWALVHMLYVSPRNSLGDRDGRPRRFLDAIRETGSVRKACRRAFGFGVPALERELIDYVEADTYLTLRLEAGDFETRAPARIAPLPEDQVLYTLAELSFALGDELHAANGVVLLEGAWHENPGNAQVAAALASVRWVQERPEEAGELLARALEMGSDAPLARLAMGNHFLLRATPADPLPAGEAEALRGRARAQFRASIALDPELPAAYAGLGATYLGAPGDVTPGIQALERARELNPSSGEFHMLLGRLYLQVGESDLAARRLRVAARWSHGGEHLEEALRLLDQARRAGEPQLGEAAAGAGASASR